MAPLQIIHPLVYVALIHEITKKDNWSKLKQRFEAFQSNSKIRCLSLPVEAQNKQSDKAQQIRQWWELIEQESISLSLEYQFLFDTDIADCYGSIYTHSIAWAIETKEVAKRNHKKTLLGNFVDQSIQQAQYQQTNGIPQGSVLMDFIAEIVLGYIDQLLTIKLQEKEIENYYILRYRDDYRIFVNDQNIGKNILKLLSEVLMTFGLKLNSSKTKNHQDVILASIKKDKLAWLQYEALNLNKISLQKHLFLIKQHSLEYPNSGSLMAALNDFYKRVKKEKQTKLNQCYKQIISIIADIAYHNPKIIAICSAIISQFSCVLDNNEFQNITLKVCSKLEKSPNSGFSQIWLQRILKDHSNVINFVEPLCQIVCGKKEINIWNHAWISDSNLLKILKEHSIFNKSIFDSLESVVQKDEFDVFSYPNVY